MTKPNARKRFINNRQGQGRLRELSGDPQARLEHSPVTLSWKYLPAGRQSTRRVAGNAAMDRINNRYGEFTLAPARLLNLSKMPNVIAPAWKPSGHRQTI